MKSLYEECLALGPNLDSDEAVYVFAESVLYLLGATGAFEFQKHIRPFCETRSAKVFRLKLREHRYSNLDIKLYMLNIARPGVTTAKSRKIATAYDISFRDAKLSWLLFSENAWFRKAVLARAKECNYMGISLSYAEVHQTFERVYPIILKYIKHITYTKLRFLVTSTNSTYADYHSELAIKLVQSYYSLVPIQLPEAHLINYLKRSVHNHAINMIKSGTTQKRARMVSTGEDANGNRRYDMLCLSQNQMALTESGDLQDVDGVDHSAAEFELRMSITEVMDGLRNKSRKYRFLTLLLGAEDKEFSAWLHNTGVCSKDEDNIDVQSDMKSSDYTKLVSEFLKVPKERVTTFFDSLKSQLAL